MIIAPAFFGCQQPVAAAGGGSLTLADLPGVFAWYEADSFALADGASISGTDVWTDLSGSGNHLTTTGSGFTFRTNVLNSQPVVRGTGAGSFTKTLGAALSQPFTVYAVVKITTAAGTNAGIVDGIALSNRAAGLLSDAAGNLAPVVDGPQGGAPYTRGNFDLMVSVSDDPASDSELWLNGTNLLDNSPLGTSVTLTGIRIFARYNDSQRMSGDIAAVILCNQHHNSTERDNVEAKLAAKYGLTVV